MTPELGAAIAGSAITLIPAVILGAVGYGRLQSKLESLSEENKSQWKVITDLRNWTTGHEKDSAQTRRELDDKIATVRELSLKNDGRWEEVLRRLGVIDGKIDKIETRGES